ncbi:MAG: phage portal protein, partial [Nitrososphaerota archaeon]
VTGYAQQTAYRVEFTPEEIVHMVLHPLADRAYGSPKLATLRRILEAKREAELFYYKVFIRKGVLSKAFIVKQADDVTFEKIKNILSETRPGDDILFSGDVEIIDLGNPVRELEILEMLRDFRQKILAVFRVPPIVYGLEGGINLETSRNQMVNFQQHIKSLQRFISAGVTEAIKRILSLDGFTIRLLEWTNPEQMVRMHSILVQSGLETINEA